MFFPRKYFRDKIEPLWASRCKVKGCNAMKRDMSALKKHLTEDHKMHMCALCIEHKQSFPSEQKMYTQAQYETHLRKGDNDGGEGHPSCDFCKKRYYDKTALFTHLSQDHHTCHLCEKQGIQFKYFNEYRDVEKHFRKDHYLCDEQLCLSKRYIVFTTLEELNHHTSQWHPFKELRRNNNGRMNIEFGKSKKRGGEADEEDAGFSSSGKKKFDAGVAGASKEGEWQISVEGTVSRDPRGENYDSGLGGSVNPSDFETNGHDTQANLVEEYPALQSNSSSSMGTINWNKSSGAGKKGNGKKDDFPSLGGVNVAHNRKISANAVDHSKLKMSSSSVMYDDSAASSDGMLFGGVKVKEDKRAKKKQEQALALAQERALNAQKSAERLQGGLGQSKVSASSSFSDAVAPKDSLAVQLHTGQVQSDHGANPPPGLSSNNNTNAAEKIRANNKAKLSVPASQGQKKNIVVSLSSSRAAAAPKKAWGNALGNLGVKAGNGGKKKLGSQLGMGMAAVGFKTNVSSSGSLDRLVSAVDAETEKAAPPMAGLDLGALMGGNYSDHFETQTAAEPAIYMPPQEVMHYEAEAEALLDAKLGNLGFASDYPPAPAAIAASAGPPPGLPPPPGAVARIKQQQQQSKPTLGTAKSIKALEKAEEQQTSYSATTKIVQPKAEGSTVNKPKMQKKKRNELQGLAFVKR